MAYEPLQVAIWIDETIRAASAVLDPLGITDLDGQLFRGTAYGSDEPPDLFISYQLQTPESDFVLQGADRLWSPQVWLITAIQRSRSIETVSQLASALDDLFHRPTRDGLPAWIHASTRIRPFMLPTLERGQRYERAGGLYRILASGQ